MGQHLRMVTFSQIHRVPTGAQISTSYAQQAAQIVMLWKATAKPHTMGMPCHTPCHAECCMGVQYCGLTA